MLFAVVDLLVNFRRPRCRKAAEYMSWYRQVHNKHENIMHPHWWQRENNLTSTCCELCRDKMSLPDIQQVLSIPALVL